MNNSNPYSILNIPDFSELDAIDTSYQKLIAEYQTKKSLTTKQKQKLQQITQAYNELTNPLTKETIDTQLQLSKIDNTHTNLLHDSFIHSEFDTEINNQEIKTFSKEKNLVSLPKSKSNLFNYILFFICILMMLYLYNNYKTLDHTEEPKLETVQEIQHLENSSPNTQIEPTLIEQNPRLIENNFFYPDPSYLETNNLIYGPDGESFPLEANVLNNLSIPEQGSSTIVVHNPHHFPIFGKTIVKYSQITQSRVNKYFYIPQKSTLHIFNMPSGSYQIHVLTLTQPTAYSSPIFTIPMGSTQTISQVANWNYPFKASYLF